MPDQSSAADEHALIQEITAPLENLPDDPVPVAADVQFPLALRGYDRIAVDAYVRKTTQLVAELQATRSPDAAVRRALERVGDEVSGILQRAHETSHQITAQSRREADDRLEQAREEAARIVAEAHNRLKDLDSETDRIWAERQQIVEDTRELARQMLALADTATDRFPPAEEAAAETPAEEEGETAAGRDQGPMEKPPEAHDDEEAEEEAGGAVEHESAGEAADHESDGAPTDENLEPVEPVGAAAHATEPDAEEEPSDDQATAVLPSVRPDESDEQPK